MTPRPTPRRAAVALAALALVAAPLLGACGEDEPESTAGDSTESTEAATDDTVVDGTVEVSDAWARTSPAMATAGAVYMVLTNPGVEDDALIEASVDPSIAATVELHETTADSGGDSGMDDSGTDASGMDEGSDPTEAAESSEGEGSEMMTMSPVSEIVVPSGETVALEPGGYHIMLLDLAEPLEVGTSIDITLTFEVLGEVVVTAEVLDQAP